MMEEIQRLITDGKTSEAIQRLNAYIETNPGSDEAWHLLGKAYYKTGEMGDESPVGYDNRKTAEL